MQATTKKQYELPPMALLSDAVASHSDHAMDTEKTAQAIEDALAALKVSVSVVATHRGPTVTQYELELNNKAMRVSKMASYEKDLSLRLGVAGIRIVAPLPDRMTVGVEVPNRVKDTVNLKGVLEGSNAPEMALPVCLGMDVIGNPIIMDLAQAPHLIVAGATGTGKSVGLNAIISSLLLFNTPSETKLILIDPKMVELSGYAGLPHLLSEPIVDMNKAGHALKWLVKHMDERYTILRKAGARDINAYNVTASTTMARVVCVIDEVAELMLACPDAEQYLARLCAKGRAAGLHVIACTQRISVDVITGLIKANIPARMCYRVADKTNSRVVLDVVGAETLLGKGDALFLAPGASTAVRMQGAYVSDTEINAIVQHCKSQGKPKYNDELLQDDEQQEEDESNISILSTQGWQFIQLFHAAVQQVIKHQSAKPGLLQRSIGFDRETSEEYIQEMERIGIVGPDQCGVRSIRKSWKQWLEMLKANDVEIDASNPYYRM